jgi:hypothetical protein
MTWGLDFFSTESDAKAKHILTTITRPWEKVNRHWWSAWNPARAMRGAPKMMIGSDANLFPRRRVGHLTPFVRSVQRVA